MQLYLFFLFIIFTFVTCNQPEKQIKEESKPAVEDSLKNITKLQEFLSKKGTLIVKDFYSLGSLKGIYTSKMEFNAVIFYEPGKEENRIKGLKIEVTQPKSYGESSESTFLDMEELESLSDALKYMSSLNEKWKDQPKEYTEVIFETKGNFSSGFYKQKNEVHAFAKAGYGSGANCFFKATDDLLRVKSKIDDGIKLLKEK
jgi:hypothetical protein